MSLRNCFARAQRMGVITKDEADALNARFDELAQSAMDPMALREQMATEIAAEAEHRKRVALISEHRRAQIVDVLNSYRNLKGETDKAEAFVMLHENMGRFGTFVDDAEGKREIIVRKAQADLGDLLKEFKRGVITGDRRRQGNWVGNAEVQARMDSVVKELFGEATGDEKAAALARAWEKVSEDLRQRFNAAGGAVQKLEKWGLPQHHNPEALLTFGREKWVAYMMGDSVLDRERTAHPLTRKPMSDAELRRALEVTFDRITTDGWIDREVAATGGAKPALYAQHADHRFLHFKGADSWLSYAKDFGRPDMFEAMMGHINTMARDIAHMETFGPNPNLTREYFKNLLRSEAAKLPNNQVVVKEQLARLEALHDQLATPNPKFREAANTVGQLLKEAESIRSKPSRNRAERRRLVAIDKEIASTMQDFDPGWKPGDSLDVVDHTILAAINDLVEEMREPLRFADHKSASDAADYLNGRINRADAMWEEMRGGRPVNVKWARRMAATRNLISAASLGGAWLSSLSDPAFGQDMRLRLGMGLAQSNMLRVMGKTLAETVTMASREDAIAAGLGLDSAMRVMQQQARYTGSIDMRSWTGFAADRVLTWGLLQPWTQAGKHAVGLDLMRWFGKQRDVNFTDLPAGLQKGLAFHGLHEAEWNALRSAPLHEPESGVGFLRPQEVEAAVGREVAEKYLGMILRETRYAVPEATVESRSIITKQPAGTLLGEIVRSGGQFKGFGIGVVMLHAGRIAREIGAGSGLNPMLYAGTFLLSSALLGAVAMSLKDIKDGRDPRKWLDEKTYLDPKMWGAALLQAGGFGIYGDLLFSDVNRFGGGLPKTLAGPLVDRIETVMDLVVNQPLNAAMGKNTKFGAAASKLPQQWIPGQNLWPTSLVAQRLLFDQLRMLIDPHAATAFREMMVKRQSDYGQQYWWQPGRTAPRRAPDMTRILSTR